MKTILHGFYYDLTIPEQKADWESLLESAKSVDHMCSWGPGAPGVSSHYMKLPKGGVEVELETNYLFSNQWNTTADSENVPNRRVFDFAYDAPGTPGQLSKTIRKGHYLEITKEMRELREATQVCGYCSAKYGKDRAPIPEDGFCPRCLGGEYLKFEQLYMLRLLPVSEHSPERDELSEEELASLEPRYREAQRIGSDERTAKAIDRMRKNAEERVTKARKGVEHAEMARDAELWCIDRGLLRQATNLIFYPHTGRFCFGWKDALKGDDLAQLLNHISEFGFPYDIKCADGRTLSGGV